jgi:Nuclease-related domain
VSFLQPAKTEAGRSALDYYEHGLRAWRRRNRPVFVIAVLMAVGIAWPVWRYFPHGQFFAGVFIGAAWGMIVWVRDDPPEFIAKWKRGAEGERKTGKILDRLAKHGWHSVHDRAGKYGNLDHIVVGTGGVFLLDSKNLSGTITLEAAGLKAEYADAPRDGFTFTSLAGAMRGASAHLKDRLAATTDITCWVQAVVVIWGHFPEAEAERDKVAYVSGDQLEAWLLRQPAKLSPRDQSLIKLGLDAEIVVGHAAPLVPTATTEEK